MSAKVPNNVIPLKAPPSKKEAQEIIRAYAERGQIAFHPHAGLRKKQRKITTPQIINCLKKGYVCEDPHIDLGHKGWMTAVTGSVSGLNLRLAVCLRWKQDILVVTCYCL